MIQYQQSKQKSANEFIIGTILLIIVKNLSITMLFHKIEIGIEGGIVMDLGIVQK